MVDGASGSTTNYQSLWALRCAQPVVCFSMPLKSSYITIAIAPTTTQAQACKPGVRSPILHYQSSKRYMQAQGQVSHLALSVIQTLQIQ